MIINPKAKTITYSLEKLEWVEASILEIEITILENDGVDSDCARSISSDLRTIRDSLGLKCGITRHKKFSPELQKP